MKTFEEVRKFLNSIPKIHDGGCGISALAMYRWLKKHNLIKNKKPFVFMYDNKYDICFIRNEEVLQGKTKSRQAASHVGLVYHKLLDCTNDRRKTFKQQYKVWHKNLDEDFLIHSLNVRHNWNNSFNRLKWIPIIEHELGINLKDIER